MEFDFKAEDPSVRPFRVRLVWALGIAVFLYLVLFTRFAWLQLFNRENYAERAEKNRTVAVTSQGSRGLIFDRNGTLVAGNELEYSLEITPDRVKDIEKTIDELSTVVTITPADRRRFKRLREDFNRYDSIPIRTQLTDVEMAVFTAQKHRFPGVEINQLERRRRLARALRRCPRHREGGAGTQLRGGTPRHARSRSPRSDRGRPRRALAFARSPEARQEPHAHG
mgnify:CR=1 FL=1